MALAGPRAAVCGALKLSLLLPILGEGACHLLFPETSHISMLVLREVPHGGGRSHFSGCLTGAGGKGDKVQGIPSKE